MYFGFKTIILTILMLTVLSRLHNYRTIKAALTSARRSLIRVIRAKNSCHPPLVTLSLRS